MTTNEAIYLGTGVIIGWVMKIPFLWKWYKELKETKDYHNRRTKAYMEEVKRLEEIYKKYK